MCTTYRSTRTALDYVAPRAATGIGPDLADWKPDVWPDYDAPAILPAGSGAEVVRGTYGFWPKFLQPQRHAEGGRKPQPFSTYNARAEEIGVKRLYAAAWRAGQRCLIPADHVVEPCWETGRNVWHRIGLSSGTPFAVAGSGSATRRRTAP